jgi:hypothetical protein
MREVIGLRKGKKDVMKPISKKKKRGGTADKSKSMMSGGNTTVHSCMTNPLSPTQNKAPRLAVHLNLTKADSFAK